MRCPICTFNAVVAGSSPARLTKLFKIKTLFIPAFQVEHRIKSINITPKSLILNCGEHRILWSRMTALVLIERFSQTSDARGFALPCSCA